MPPLTDPERLKHYRNALSNWKWSGYVEYSQLANEWVRSELELTRRAFSQMMWEYVIGGGEIDEVRETRTEYLEHEFHHDLRFDVGGRMVYVETRLLMEHDIEDTSIYVVNVHDA
jgi:hypothetical protein